MIIIVMIIIINFIIVISIKRENFRPKQEDNPCYKENRRKHKAK